MSGIDRILLKERHGFYNSYGWDDYASLSSLVATPKEVMSMEDVESKMKEVLYNYSFDSFKSAVTIVIDSICASELNVDNAHNVMPFYNKHNKENIFNKKPLLSCEYALMLDVLKTA